MEAINSTIQILLTRFNGQILIPFIDGAEAAGFAGQTARNKVHKGEFPIPTILNGSRRLIHIRDLACFIDTLRDKSIAPVKPKRGARTKASRIEGAL